MYKFHEIFTEICNAICSKMLTVKKNREKLHLYSRIDKIKTAQIAT